MIDLAHQVQRFSQNNWLPIHERESQRSLRSSYQKLNVPHRKQMLDEKPYLMLVLHFGKV